MLDPATKPTPEPSQDTAPYWEGLKDGRFLLQRCTSCGMYRHYPRPICSACYSEEVAWKEASGEAMIHSWTVCHHAFLPAFKPDLPYILVLADLPEGVRVNLQASGLNPDELRIGLPLRIAFRPPATGEFALPVLVRA